MLRAYCMSIWVTGKVVDIKYWTNQLFTIIVHAPVEMFIAGQFAKIGMKINNLVIQRAYSYLNSPDNSNLEFYITTIQGGRLTPFLRSLQLGDTIMLTRKSFGHFILEKIPSCENLWMLATGTGISPYLSILEYCDSKLDAFSNIVLVHAVRFYENLNYLFKMKKLQKIYHNRLHIQTVLSREHSVCSLYGRIPMLLENNLLEEKVGLRLNPHNSHVMLCGNPRMIFDVRRVLQKKYNMKDNLKNSVGQITQERYW